MEGYIARFNQAAPKHETRARRGCDRLLWLRCGNGVIGQNLAVVASLVVCTHTKTADDLQRSHQNSSACAVAGVGRCNV